AVLEGFLEQLPRTTETYIALARQADARLKTPPYLEPAGVEKIRHAIEPRHPSFDTPECRALLARYNVALVIADTPEQPQRERLASGR
ncbi:MAG: DUF72 domain-containing protein, partial [Verrucomicrobiaceae bacterium]